MGVYCTTTSLDVIMVGTVMTGQTALASKCIDWAESHIDKALGKRYDVGSWTTSAATPPHVTTLAEWLASGFMYQRLARGGKEGVKRGQDEIDRANEDLEAITKGEMTLVDSSGDEIAEREDRVLCNTTDYSNTFNEDDELTWNVDQDKVDDIDSERSM